MLRPFLACSLLALATPLAAQTAAPAAGPAPIRTQPVPTPEPLARADFVARLDEEFARMDSNHDDVLTLAEVEAAQRAGAQAEALRQNQAVFARLDRDRDGKLSPQEFATLANLDALPSTAATLIQRLDGNRDGRVTKVEHRAATQANYDRMDADRDGVLTAAEILAANRAAAQPAPATPR